MSKCFRWKSEHIEYIKEIAPNKTTEEITNLFNARFGADMTTSRLRSSMSRLGLKSGLRKARTVGEQFTWKNGDKMIKVAESQRAIKPQHIWLWESHYGAIPKGCRIIFKDNNKDNIVIDNLMMITTSELASMRKNRLLSTDPKATECGYLLAKLRLMISQKEKELRRKEHNG